MVHKNLYFLLQRKQSWYRFRGDSCWQKTEILGSTEEDGLAACFCFFFLLIFPEWKVRFSSKRIHTEMSEWKVEHCSIQPQSTVICATLAPRCKFELKWGNYPYCIFFQQLFMYWKYIYSIMCILRLNYRCWFRGQISSNKRGLGLSMKMITVSCVL